MDADALDVFQRVRERGFVRCAAVVRPGIAVPSADGAAWFGIAPDMCRAVAAAVFGDPARIAFRPYPIVASTAAAGPDDIVFESGDQVVANAANAPAALVLGPTIVHDALAILVHAAGPMDVAALADRSVCVEPGSASDRALTRYFSAGAIPLREHPFQEADEMRQAYETGNCDALAGPLSTLASVRADPREGHAADRVLPQLLADDPIFAATPADARWSQIVWWTFSALVDAEDAGITGRNARAVPAIPGVPPALGPALGLPATWALDAVAAHGNYGELFDRSLGTSSRLRVPRGANALVRNGGSIFALHVE